MGSFICMKQHCSHCDYTFTWKNKPCVKDTPAANILMSAAILLSGSTPVKVLLMMKHLNMASITERTFFDNQRKYLAPAIVSVLGENQSNLLSDCVSKGPLTVGGDGRVDSPGHSAKYGSYGIIDLSSNKVIYIELVQVSICLCRNCQCYNILKCHNRAMK